MTNELLPPPLTPREEGEMYSFPKLIYLALLCFTFFTLHDTFTVVSDATRKKENKETIIIYFLSLSAKCYLSNYAYVQMIFTVDS